MDETGCYQACFSPKRTYTSSNWFRAPGGALRHSETILLKLGVDVVERLVSNGSSSGGLSLDLGVVESLGLDLSLFFEFSDESSLGPSLHLGEVSEHAEVSVGLQSKDLESLGHDHSLSDIVWVRDTLEDLQVGESGLSTGLLVWDHASDASPEHSGWASEVLEVSSGVGVVSLVSDLFLVKVVSEQRSADVDLLTSDDNDLLASEDLLSHDRSKSSVQMASSVYDNLLFEHT